MRVSRIFGMQSRLRETYGERVEFDGETYFAYPTPERLAEATEDELRDLSLGYRAPYVRRTAEMVATGEATPAEARGRDYEDAREFLTTFVGVGDKVADCVLLFSLDYLEAVPLDTWIRSAIEEHYPRLRPGELRRHLAGHPRAPRRSLRRLHPDVRVSLPSLRRGVSATRRTGKKVDSLRHTTSSYPWTAESSSRPRSRCTTWRPSTRRFVSPSRRPARCSIPT
ncbi:DNA N-glycosylase [Haloferax sp. BAB-2207]|nr:DNA N-glycosylase [Haloferax sp. BAB-2207]